MSTPQNIYDDPDFFAGYRDLRTNDSGLNGVLEMPALHALLPDLAGAHVLALGSGSRQREPAAAVPAAGGPAPRLTTSWAPTPSGSAARNRRA
jgi:hypothetical protein